MARAVDPLRASRVPTGHALSATHGNRFDSPLGDYGVRYFATDLDGCFGETLARFRPDPALQAVASEQGFMALGEVPADWRRRRVAVRAHPRSAARFLNVEDGDVRERLRRDLAEILVRLGHADLDIATVRGADRRLTRWISYWAHEYEDEEGGLAGVRYLSRLDSSWECWAVFEEVELVGDVAHPVDRTQPALLRVANRYGVRVF